MPWFGKTAEEEKKEVDKAKMSYDAVASTLQRLSSKCFERCTKYLNKSELATSEMVCLDRCTAKYMFTINLVGTRTQEISEKFKQNLK